MYESKKLYGSDVHIYTFDPKKYRIENEKAGANTTAPLSRIEAPRGNEVVAAKINAAFFGGPSLHDGPYISKGLWYGTLSENYLGVIFTHKHKLLFEKITDIKRASYWQGNSFWVFGGSFTLTLNGKVDITNTAAFPHWTERQPRTAIGQKSTGEIVLVVVDGRRVTSMGVTGTQLANIMLDLGCFNSINLDGGGSTQMIVGTKTVNTPSDGYERYMGMGLVVYRPYLVALDDGHGLETSGKRTPLFPDGSFMKENEFNFAVMEKLEARLKAHGFDTLHAAPGRTDLSLASRTARANATVQNGYGYPADFFMSIHANATAEFAWNNTRGIETYIFGYGGQAGIAADIIHRHLIDMTKQADRRVKTANFYVLRQTHMPAILYELGFMTNTTDALLLLSDEYRHVCAEAITKGFCEYRNIKYTPVAYKAIQIPPGNDIINDINWEDKYNDLKAEIEALYKKLL